jgi:hypothetical protein
MSRLAGSAWVLEPMVIYLLCAGIVGTCRGESVTGGAQWPVVGTAGEEQRRKKQQPVPPGCTCKSEG